MVEIINLILGFGSLILVAYGLVDVGLALILFNILAVLCTIGGRLKETQEDDR